MSLTLISPRAGESGETIPQAVISAVPERIVPFQEICEKMPDSKPGDLVQVCNAGIRDVNVIASLLTDHATINKCITAERVKIKGELWGETEQMYANTGGWYTLKDLLVAFKRAKGENAADRLECLRTQFNEIAIKPNVFASPSGFAETMLHYVETPVMVRPPTE